MDKLGLYNSALIKIGAERLSSETEETERRYRIDDVYEKSVEYCLQTAQPYTNSKVQSLTSDGVHTLGLSYPFPDDYVALVGAYVDANLDKEAARKLIEGRKLITDSDTIFIRYISDSYIVDDWSSTFCEVVANKIAVEIGLYFTPDRVSTLNEMLGGSVEVQHQINKENEPNLRVRKSNNTLTPAWMNVYNDALQIMGKTTRITTTKDTSEERDAFETALNAGLILASIESYEWTWATHSQKLYVNPSLEPDWGYKDVYDLPSDFVRFDGIYSDEDMRCEIIDFKKEDGNLFVSGYSELYIQYVSDNEINNPDYWPPTVKRFIAAKLAEETVFTLKGNVDNALRVYDERKREAENTDALQSPPVLIQPGSWSRRDTEKILDDNSTVIPNG